MRLIHAFLVALLISACSPSATTAASGQAQEAAQPRTAHPVSGLPVIPLIIKHGAVRHQFQVELAKSRLEQAKGLMFRIEMGADEGMLFPMEPPRDASFWMKNTVIPLDMIFIGVDHRILNIEANAVPYSEEPRRSAGTAIGVLELNGGRAAQLGISVGDKVDW